MIICLENTENEVLNFLTYTSYNCKTNVDSWSLTMKANHSVLTEYFLVWKFQFVCSHRMTEYIHYSFHLQNNTFYFSYGIILTYYILNIIKIN